MIKVVIEEEPWRPDDGQCQHGLAMWLCATPGGSTNDPHYPNW